MGLAIKQKQELPRELSIPKQEGDETRFGPLRLNRNAIIAFNNLRGTWFTATPENQSQIQTQMKDLWERWRTNIGQRKATEEEIAQIITELIQIGSVAAPTTEQPPVVARRSGTELRSYEQIVGSTSLPQWLDQLRQTDERKFSRIMDLLQLLKKYKEGLTTKEMLELLELGHKIGNTTEVLETALKICRLEGKYTNYPALINKIISDTSSYFRQYGQSELTQEHLHYIIRCVVTECEKREYARDPVASKPLTILGLMFIESRFAQFARSPADCYGLMQLKRDGGYGQFNQGNPGKYTWQQATATSRTSEKINIEIGIWYLHYLFMYNAYGIQLKDWKQIGAYNGGPGNPQRSYFDDVSSYYNELRKATQSRK